MEKIEVFEITPAQSSHHDSTIVLAGESWASALEMAELVMENQFDEKPWGEIKVSIKCRYMTQQQIDELDDGRD